MIACVSFYGPNYAGAAFIGMMVIFYLIGYYFCTDAVEE